MGQTLLSKVRASLEAGGGNVREYIHKSDLIGKYYFSFAGFLFSFFNINFLVSKVNNVIEYSHLQILLIFLPGFRTQSDPGTSAGTLLLKMTWK